MGKGKQQGGESELVQLFMNCYFKQVGKGHVLGATDIYLLATPFPFFSGGQTGRI